MKGPAMNDPDHIYAHGVYDGYALALMTLCGEGMDAAEVRAVDRYVRKIGRMRGMKPASSPP